MFCTSNPPPITSYAILPPLPESSAGVASATNCTYVRDLVYRGGNLPQEFLFVMKKFFFTLLGVAISSCQHPGPPRTPASASKIRSTSPTASRVPYHTPYGDDQYATYLQQRFTPYLGKFSTKLEEKHPSFSLAKNIPPVLQPEVDRWIHYFKTKANRILRQWLVRGDALASTIIPILEAQDVPTELFYVAMIESGFNNHACSPRQAAGPWQLIGATARLHGLEMTRWVDERRDPVKATLAAVVYWKKLYQQFDNWNLAIAAYNSTPLTIQNLLRHTSREKFWTYSKGKVKRETREFVP